MLQQLLRIKKMREQGAKQKVNASTQALLLAEQEYLRAKQAWTAYIEWRSGEETRLFESIQQATVALSDIENFNLHVGLLRQKDVQLEQAIQQSRLQQEQAETELASAKSVHKSMAKSVEKVAILFDQEQEQQQQLAQYREELEHEEFVRREREA